MAVRYRRLDDLKDSAMMYSKNPPRFMTVILIVILACMVVAVVVADASKKSEIINGVGVTQSEDKTYVMSPAGGKIDEIFVEEGQSVEKGDALIRIGSAETEAQYRMYADLSDYYWSVLGGYKRMYDMILNYDINNDVGANNRNKNPFDVNSERIVYLACKSFLEEISKIEADADHTLSENRQSFLDQILMECNQVIMQYEPTYKQALYQKEYAQALVEESTIRANAGGIIHFETILNTGMVSSAGSLLFSISSAAEDAGMVVNLQIPAAYRPHLSEGCLVQMEVVGYPSSTYGKAEGRITEIASDSTVDANGNVWFIVKVEIADATLSSKAGQVQIVNGMMVMASMVYEESTWLDWILKGLGFR